MTIAEPMGQGWLQLSELGLAFLLSALIRFEHEMRRKSADLPTYVLVGLGSALILLASKYGFTNIRGSNRFVLDPSGIAAQIAIATIAGYFIVVVILPAIERCLPKSRWAPVSIHVAYCGGRDVLKQILTACPQHDFAVTRLRVEQQDDEQRAAKQPERVVKLLIEVHGTKSIPKLAAQIADIPGVASVQAGDAASD